MPTKRPVTIVGLIIGSATLIFACGLVGLCAGTFWAVLILTLRFFGVN